MKSVTQEHSSGCSVACVASVLGISYKRALKLFEKPEYAGTRGYYCREIVNALKNGGKRYSYAFLKPNKKKLARIPGSIIFIRKSIRYPLGHFLARCDDIRWMDPWINYPEVKSAKSGFRKTLPGKASWVIYPERQ